MISEEDIVVEANHRVRIAENIRRIKQDGILALQVGNVVPFTHQSVNLVNNFTCVMRPTVESVLAVNARVRVVAATEAVGAMYFFQAGRNFPMHSTLCEGVWKGDDDRRVVFDELRRALPSEINGQVFQGLEVEYDTLVADGANLLLMASRIPDVVVEVRKKLASIYERHGLAPKIISDALYIVLGRINYLPEDTEQRKQTTSVFLEWVMSANEYLAAHPLTVTMAEAQCDETFRFLNCGL